MTQTAKNTSLVPVKQACPLCEGAGKVEIPPKLSPFRQNLVHELVNGGHSTKTSAYLAAGYKQRWNGHRGAQAENTQLALAIAEREKRDKATGIGKKARELIDSGLKESQGLPADVKVGMGLKLLEVAEKLGDSDQIDELSKLGLEAKLRKAYLTGLKQGLGHPERAKLHKCKVERLLGGAKVERPKTPKGPVSQAIIEISESTEPLVTNAPPTSS